MPDRTSLPIIGWREWVSLPDFGIKHIKAKIDTGARSSSLHAESIEPFEVDGESWVRFNILPVQRKDTRIVAVTAPIFDTRPIRSSSGETQDRYVIKTHLHMLGKKFEIELTLADRNQMGFRMLLGRESFRRRYLINPGKSYLGGDRKKRKRHN